MATPNTDGLLLAADGLQRCWWYGGLPDYMQYHDEEWGHPVTDDIRLFEKICLEGFQSGLSWLTILRKRDNFRTAFDGFDFEKVARFTAQDVERLLQDAGIIRHRKKIESTINNAQKACELVEQEGSLARYFWQFEPPPAQRPRTFDYATLKQLGQTPTSQAISKDLKKRGWSFVGPTTAYAFMQAMGLVNDHLEGCHCREVVEQKRRALDRNF
ncbi:MAG: DNA-3-methyladenine glycosylase I [Saprospiraceae bacterium]